MDRILGGVVRRVLDANNEAVHRQNEGNDPLAWVFLFIAADQPESQRNQPRPDQGGRSPVSDRFMQEPL